MHMKDHITAMEECVKNELLAEMPKEQRKDDLLVVQGIDLNGTLFYATENQPDTLLKQELLEDLSMEMEKVF